MHVCVWMSELCKGVKEEAKESCKGEREECFPGTKSACKSPGILRLTCSALVWWEYGVTYACRYRWEREWGCLLVFLTCKYLHGSDKSKGCFSQIEIRKCLFSVPLLSTLCPMLRMAEFVCCWQHSKHVRQASSCRGELRHVQKMWGCSVPPTSNVCKTEGKRPVTLSSSPDPSPGWCLWHPKISSPGQAAPTPRMWNHSSICSVCKTMGYDLIQEREMYPPGFSSWGPLPLTLSLHSSGGLWVLVAPHHSLLSVHVCAGAHRACSSPWACEAGGTAASCSGGKQQRLSDALLRCSLLTPVQTANVPTGTWRKSCWREMQREWGHWRWHYEATEPCLHQLFHLFLFCFETNMSWADTENKICPCIQLLR